MLIIVYFIFNTVFVLHVNNPKSSLNENNPNYTAFKPIVDDEENVAQAAELSSTG